LVGLDDLAAALAQPAAHYLRRRAGLAPSVLARDDEPDPAWEAELPLDLDGLARWQITDRMLRLRRAGHSPDAIRLAERLRGTLPPRALGEPVLAQCWRAVERALAAAAPYEEEPLSWRAVDIETPGRPRLTGQLGVRGDVLVTVQAGQPQAKQQLTAWIHVLALQTAWPDRPWRAVLIGPGGWTALSPGDPGEAPGRLARLLDWQAAGGAAVLPAPPLTALWAARFHARGQSPDPVGLRRVWAVEWGRDPAWQTVYAEPANLFDAPVPPLGPDGLADAPSAGGGFARLVDELYVPLFRAGGSTPLSIGGRP
jgi:exodeoxyribonuclease V gamma subunit